MGYGQYIGNLSVHWEVVHEDPQGQRVALTGATGKRAGKGAGKGAAHTLDVGDGIKGRDPVKVPDVGRRKGHTGCFRVRLRFERMQDAKAAAEAAQSVMFEDGMFVLVLDVPVIPRADVSDPPPAEVRVDW